MWLQLPFQWVTTSNIVIISVVSVGILLLLLLLASAVTTTDGTVFIHATSHGTSVIVNLCSLCSLILWLLLYISSSLWLDVIITT